MNEEKKVPFKWEYGEETISLQLGMYANNQRLYIGMITHTEDPAYVSEDNVTSCAMQTFIAGYCEISLIKSVSERRNYFEPGTDEYYNRKANTSSANTIGNDTGRTSRGIECYPAGTIELGERC